MAMGSSKVPEQPLRYRVTVPLRDADVINWMAEQSNVSFSIRTLIKAFVAKYGMTDVTCLPASAGLDMDITGNDVQQAQANTQMGSKKTSVSLSEIKQGQFRPVPAQAPMQTPAQVAPTQVPARPVASPQPQAPVVPPAAPVAKPAPAGPVQNVGYTPTEIEDLM